MITILPYPKIEMNIIGYTVIVKNVGNVKYNNETTIVVEKENKTYLINKKIKLDVGEESIIDLSKDVPSGNYTVTLPAETITNTITEERIIEKTTEKIIEKEVPRYIEKEGETYTEGESEIKAEEKEASNVIENVEIEDGRPPYKKGLEWMTGLVIAGAGMLLKRPGLASSMIIITVLSLIGYYNRERIEKIIEKIKERRERF